jgi:hypothetical protein
LPVNTVYKHKDIHGSSKSKAYSTIQCQNISSTTAIALTWHSIHKGIEESNYEVDKHSAVEQYVTPQCHVRTDPKQKWLAWK